MGTPFKKQLCIALILTGLIAGGLSMLTAPPWVAYVAAINLVTLGYYGWDKWRAIKNKSRTPEWCLHVLALLGGVLGAFAGRQWFRHKTLKKSFRIIFWIIAVLQIAGLVLWWYYDPF